MQTANEILQNILGVLVQIQSNSSNDKKDDKKVKEDGAKQIVNISSALSSFAGVKEKTKQSFINFVKDLFEISSGGKAKVLNAFSDGIVKISQSLPMLSEGLGSLSKGAFWGRTSRALDVLKSLFNLMDEIGSKKSGNIEKAIKLFDEMGKSLKELGGGLRTLSNFLMLLGLSFVVFAAGLVLSSMILGSSNPLWGVAVLLAVVGVLILVFMGVGRIEKYLQPGIDIIKGIGVAFGWLILGIVGFVVGLLLTSLLIGAGGGVKGIAASFGIMLLTIGIILAMFMFIGMIGDYIKPGIETIKGIGFSFVLLILGIWLFATGLVLISSLLGEAPNTKGIVSAGLIILGSILMVSFIFWILGQVKGTVDKGIKTVLGMGLGLFILIMAVFLFATGLILIAKNMGESQNGSGIAMAFLIMGASVAGIVMLFRILGKSLSHVAKGFAAVALISIGLIFIAVSMMFIAEAAKKIQSLLGTGGAGDVEVPLIGTIPGGIIALGTMALIFIAATGIFALLGIPVVAALIILGSVTAIMISLALISVAVSMVSMVNAVKKVGDVNVEETISKSIGAVLTGVLNGISVLTEGKSGIKGFIAFQKNSLKLFAAIGILMALSISLSMFARALTAFAVLGNMRIITGTDSKGSPIFGETVSTVAVAANIAESIRLFLSSLIESTDGLTKEKGKEIERMMKLLTGKNGILIAVNQFSEVVQTFAKFGNSGEIGYIDTIAGKGKDKDGNPNIEKVYKKVKITTVVRNIIGAFSKFVDGIVQMGKELDLENGNTGKKMAQLAVILMGSKFAISAFPGIGFSKEKPGILEPILKFSELIARYADASEDGSITMLDAEGKNPKKINPANAAKSLMAGIKTFIDTVASDTALDSSKIDDAEKKVKKIENLISTLSDASEMMKSISNLSENIGKLGENIEKLGQSLSGEFDIGNLKAFTESLEKINAMQFANVEKLKTVGNAAQNMGSGGGSGGPGGGGSSKGNEGPVELSQNSINALANAISKEMNSTCNFVFTYSGSNEGIIKKSK